MYSVEHTDRLTTTKFVSPAGTYVVYSPSADKTADDVGTHLPGCWLNCSVMEKKRKGKRVAVFTKPFYHLTPRYPV